MCNKSFIHKTISKTVWICRKTEYSLERESYKTSIYNKAKSLYNILHLSVVIYEETHLFISRPQTMTLLTKITKIKIVE